jgi:hypothetical protein
MELQQNTLFLNDVGGIAESRLDILKCYMIILLDGLLRLSRGQILENHGHYHSCPLDARSPMANVWVDADALMPVHRRHPAPCHQV